MKGLVLAAGEGKRLTELKLRHKSFAKINGKCVIDYSLDMLADQKGAITEIVIVVGHNADSIVDYLGNSYKGINLKYVVQKERLGIAHAIMTAKDSLEDDFVLCLADEILINNKLDKMIESFQAEKTILCMCGVINNKDDFSMKPIAYDMDEFGNVICVREKPDHYKNELRGVGECVFSYRALDYLQYLKPNPKRGEYEMGDFIQLLIDRADRTSRCGELDVVRTFEIADDYVNVNRPTDIDAADFLVSKVIKD